MKNVIVLHIKLVEEHNARIVDVNILKTEFKLKTEMKTKCVVCVTNLNS